MSVRVDLYRNDNKVVIDAFDCLVVNVFMEKEKNQHKSLLICGCDAGSGATSIAVELAISLAVSGWRTVLVDADLRKDPKHKRLNQKVEKGLSEYVSSIIEKSDIINETNWKNLDYISSGRKERETPVKLLCSQRMRKLQEELRREYDFVIYDSPSLNAIVDATILAAQVDYTYLVVAAEQTTFQNLTSARKQLERVGANIAGMIVNKISSDEYSRYMDDYNYFIQKEYVHQNTYYRNHNKDKNEKKKISFISKLKKIMGCFILGCFLLMGIGESGVVAAENPVMFENTSTLPNIFVVNYEILEGIPMIGDAFTLEVTVKNMNRHVAADQVSVSLGLKTEGIYLQHGETNQRYIECLKPNETKEFLFRLSTVENFSGDAALIDVRFDYVNENGNVGTNTTSISPELRKKCEVEIISITAAKRASVGAKALFNIQYGNFGEIEVKNLKMRIDGNIEGSGKEIPLSIPAPGMQEYLDQYVIFTETGNQVLTVQLLYEDKNGVTYELESQKVFTLVTQDFLVDEEKESEISGELEEVKFDTYNPLLQISLGVSGVLFFAVILAKIKKSRKSVYQVLENEYAVLKNMLEEIRLENENYVWIYDELNEKYSSEHEKSIEKVEREKKES